MINRILKAVVPKKRMIEMFTVKVDDAHFESGILNLYAVYIVNLRGSG